MNRFEALPSAAHLPERLPFRLHDFTRFSWVSDEARAVWEPRIHRVTDMLFEVETKAIAEGNRKCALRSLTVDQLDETRATLAARGLRVVTLQPIRISSSYSSTLDPCRGETPYAYWCGLGIEPFLSHLEKAFHDNDQRTIGRLLGYSMDRAHASIVDVAKQLISQQTPRNETNLVIDFGCGNGALVRKITQLAERLEPGGIDFDADKIAHAKLVNSSPGKSHFQTGDIFKLELLDRFDTIYLVVLMIGRLTEVPPESAQGLLTRIREKSQHMIVYAYHDYINTNDSVEAIAAKVGLPLGDGLMNVRLADLRNPIVNQEKKHLEYDFD